MMRTIVNKRMDEFKYDKRLIAIGQIPIDYEDYLKSLKCCVCGSIEPCKCTIKDLKAKQLERKEP